MQTLTEFKAGDKIEITNVACGQEFRRRLFELGLFDGADVEVIKNDKSGPILLKIFDSKWFIIL